MALMILATIILAAPSTIAEEFEGGGEVHGMVYGYDMDGQLVALSWATVTAYKDGEVVGVVYTSDGFYSMYVPGGWIEVTIEHPGYETRSREVYVSDGSSTALNFNLERSNEPIPEYSSHLLPLALASAFMVVWLILRRREPRPT